MTPKGLFGFSLKKTLGRVLGSGISREEIFEELEELLILADISADRAGRIIAGLRKRGRLSFERDDFFAALKEELVRILAPGNDLEPDPEPALPAEKSVWLLVGVNGSGKTTTAAKLAHLYRKRGRRVLLAAADTFRAAGSSQLALWGERLRIPVIGGDRGADPGSVVFNSLNALASRDHDLLIVDTAGRVQTRENLMKELEKITRVVAKFYSDQPAETLLVLDATMGQNTLDQARRFRDFSGITGIVLAKLDGTARGGTVVNIMDEMGIPVKFAGTGEGEDDLVPFSVKDFVDSLLAD